MTEEVTTRTRIQNILKCNRLPEYASILNVDRDPRNTSTRYKETDELAIIEYLNQIGFYITSYSQSRAHKPEEIKFKPYLAIYESTSSRGDGEGKVRLAQLGSKDGTTKLSFLLEYRRLAKGISLVPSESVCPLVGIKHIGDYAQGIDDTLKQLFKYIPDIYQRVAQFKNKSLDVLQMLDFATRAADLRFTDGRFKVNPHALLIPRPGEDTTPSVWNILNRLQDVLVNSPELYLPTTSGKRRKVKEIVNVKANINLRKALWQLAESYL
jgi:hypothetical protein